MTANSPVDRSGIFYDNSLQGSCDIFGQIKDFFEVDQDFFPLDNIDRIGALTEQFPHLLTVSLIATRFQVDDSFAAGLQAQTFFFHVLQADNRFFDLFAAFQNQFRHFANPFRRFIDIV